MKALSYFFLTVSVVPFAASGKLSPFILNLYVLDNRMTAEPLHTRLVNIDGPGVANRIVLLFTIDTCSRTIFRVRPYNKCSAISTQRDETTEEISTAWVTGFDIGLLLPLSTSAGKDVGRAASVLPSALREMDLPKLSSAPGLLALI